MKRKISLLLILTFLSSLFLVACDKDSDSVNYQVNTGDTIYIGAILPLSGDYKTQGDKLSEGLKYSNETASKINIDKEYDIELIIKDVADLDLAYNEFIDKKVAGIVCSGTDNKKTDAIISKFANTSIPLIFTDNYSAEISESSTAFSICVSDAYATSCAVSQLSSMGHKKGGFINLSDDEQSLKFPEMLSNAAKGVGITVTDYAVYGENANYSTKSFVSMDYEFCFINGPTLESVNMVKELRDAGFTGDIMLSEVMDKTMLYADCEDVLFINKFDYDDDNYIGSDFINVYSEKMAIENGDCNSAIAYAYDSYMLIYEALHSFSGRSDDPLSAVKKDNKDSVDEQLIINSEDIVKALYNTAYFGVTDEISFDDKGINHVNFVYIHTIDSQSALMLNKYKYAN